MTNQPGVFSRRVARLAPAGATVLGLMLLAGSAPAESAVLARIALVADPHVNRATNGLEATFGAHFDAVISQVNAAKVDCVLIAGDLTQSGGPKEMEDFRREIKKFRAPVFFVAGNHDVGNKRHAGQSGEVTAERLALYEKRLGHSFFVTKRHGVRIIGINASLLGSGLPEEDKQWRFLETRLARPSGPTLLLLHYPPFVKTPEEPGGGYWNLEPGPRARLLRLLRPGGVRAVLSGHLHREVVNHADGILFVTSPPVSFGLPRGKQPEGWTLIIVPRTGEVRAEFRHID
ncbi:MAG: metallophosphoesterase [Verrucomicrobiota bacterium]|nr:metallophosphoesterase [Verrucomicrobiota bacterium]MDE3068886.1 metallophosphoesterase [Verrucomicrobiota bacterium]